MLKPLNITQGGNRSEGGPDIIPLADRGVPVVLFEQDASDLLHVHHTANDTLDKVDRSDLRTHNVSAFAVFAYLAANHESDFGSAVTKRIRPFRRPTNTDGTKSGG